MNTETPFETFLNQHDEEAWSATLVTLLRSIHEVDRNATQIWFAFYPLPLFRAVEQSADRDKFTQQLLLQGDYELKDQIDSSHAFLYGHRFWPQVKQAVEQHAEAFNQTLRASLADQILAVARSLAQELKKDESLLVGTTAVAFMITQQTVVSALTHAACTISIHSNHKRKQPHQNVPSRDKDDRQG